MDPGYHSPLIDVLRRPDTPRDLRVLAARGAISPNAHEQLALLILLADDDDTEIAGAADSTIAALPIDALCVFLAGADVPPQMRQFFASRGIVPATRTEGDDSPELFPAEPEEPDAGAGGALVAGLPVKTKIKLALTGTREQRAQLIRDSNRIVAAAVLSSPKLTEPEVESFAKMANVSEDVLRIIGTSRGWLKNYGTVLGLVRNPKTPPSISMQLLSRLTERDMKLLVLDRNVPEALKLSARKFVVKGLR